MNRFAVEVMRRRHRWSLLASARHLVPDDHTGPGWHRRRRHVGEHVSRSAGEGHHEDPGEELRRAAGAGLLHSFERALAEQRRMVATFEQVEEPAIELLVDPEVAGPTGLVRE